MVLWPLHYIFQDWGLFFVAKYKASFNESAQSVWNNWLTNQQQLWAYKSVALLSITYSKIENCLYLICSKIQSNMMNLSSPSWITGSKTNNSFYWMNLFQTTKHYWMNLSSQSEIIGSNTNNIFGHTTQHLLGVVFWLFHHLFQEWGMSSYKFIPNTKHYSMNLSSQSEIVCSNIEDWQYQNSFQNREHYSMNLSNPSGIPGSKSNNSFKCKNQQLLCLFLCFFQHILKFGIVVI